jgi:hypothetical protein
MHCPYCNGLNPDQSSYCVRCGRDLTHTTQVSHTTSGNSRPFTPSAPPPPNMQRTVYPPTSPVQRPAPAGQPRQGGSAQQPQTRPTVYPSTPPVSPKPARPTATSTPTRPTVAPAVQPLPAAPTNLEPPVTFPPKTIAQLQALTAEGLEYTVLNDDETYGKKRIVRISFRRCAPWQQIATLLKALQQYKNTQLDTVIIQGVQGVDNQKHDAFTHSYEYTNGQLTFDRNVRLGSQTQNRYQIETDNGYSVEAQRIVLAE